MSAYDDTAARAFAETVTPRGPDADNGMTYPLGAIIAAQRAGIVEGARWEHHRQYPEVERLRRWKAEALPIIVWLQDLGRALNLRPGTRITGQDALDAVLDLRRQLAAARQPTEAQIDAAAQVLALHEYDVALPSFTPKCGCGWSADEPHDTDAFERHAARAALLAAAGAR